MEAREREGEDGKRDEGRREKGEERWVKGKTRRLAMAPCSQNSRSTTGCGAACLSICHHVYSLDDNLSSLIAPALYM